MECAPTRGDVYRHEFERNGVVLMRDAILASELREVIREYERTGPQSMPTPKHQPIVVFWTHKPGERKKIALLAAMPNMEEFTRHCARIARRFAPVGALRLMETVIFNKPPREGTELVWHQDVAYWPLEPNNQIALWIPFDKVTKENGALSYALGSHKRGLRSSTDLHSNAVLSQEDIREPIPADPAAAGFTVQCMDMEPGDVLLHDGRTWHTSGPNRTDLPRRGLTVRFLIGDTVYSPRPGSAAAFIQQIDVSAGERIDNPAFPVLA